MVMVYGVISCFIGLWEQLKNMGHKKKQKAVLAPSKVDCDNKACATESQGLPITLREKQQQRSPQVGKTLHRMSWL